VASCEGLPSIQLQLGGTAAPPRANFVGLIAADEPQAVLVAQQILLAKGNAIDAAVAMGFTLSVTLPSSAGLGGGGACIVHDAVSGTTEALDFTLKASSDDGAARYRAAVPALARGLFALHAKYGAAPWQQAVMPAENLARFGHQVTRAFARDLAADGGVLVNDRTALAAFMTPRRQTVQAGDNLKQLDLATVLGRLRGRGPGDLYAGALGKDTEDAIAAAGSAITAADLREYLPRWVPAGAFDEGQTRFFYLPADIGGADFAAAFARGPQSAAGESASGSTSYVVADAAGGAVACTLSMGRAFGLGIMPAGLGFLLAPAPDGLGAEAPMLAPVMGINHPTNRMVFMGASGGVDAMTQAIAAARAVMIEGHTPAQFAATLEKAQDTTQAPARRSGLVTILSCRISAEAAPVCEAQADPRGAGYALIVGPEN